jgi:hypothetical protein
MESSNNKWVEVGALLQSVVVQGANRTAVGGGRRQPGGRGFGPFFRNDVVALIRIPFLPGLASHSHESSRLPRLAIADCFRATFTYRKA